MTLCRTMFPTAKQKTLTKTRMMILSKTDSSIFKWPCLENSIKYSSEKKPIVVKRKSGNEIVMDKLEFLNKVRNKRGLCFLTFSYQILSFIIKLDMHKFRNLINHVKVT
jgi:predicted RNase H-like nuclease